MSTSVKITVEQYQAMIARGDFDPPEDHHVELIRGETVPRFSDDPRTPMNSPHVNTVMELADWSYEVLPSDDDRVSVQGSISIPALDSVPQPDIAWLLRKNYSKQLPTPEDILLLIEVSDSSIAKDRGPKLELYAEAKIREYWIVNVRSRSIDVYHDPHGTTYTHPRKFPHWPAGAAGPLFPWHGRPGRANTFWDAYYGIVTTFTFDQEVRPLAFPQIALPVSRIFPD